MYTVTIRRTLRRGPALLAALTVTAGTALVSAGPAGARDAAERAVPAHSAVVRGAHFSPDTPGVDVYLTAYSGGRSTIWLSNVGYGDVSGYRRLDPGVYVVSMRKHGAPRSSPAALSWTLDAKAGAAYTVAAVGENAKLRGIVLRDRLDAPRSGTGLLRVIQAASRAPVATLVAGSRTVAARADFASTTGYSAVPAGTWTVRASSTDSHSVSASSRVAIKPSGVYTLVLLDSKGSGIQLRVLHDASGAGVSPSGAVDAGGGGTASGLTGTGAFAGSTSVALDVCALLGSALLIGVLAVGRRRSLR